MDVRPAGCWSAPFCSWTRCWPCGPGRCRTGPCSAPTARYDDIRLTVFPHGTESVGLPGISEWQAVLGHARQHGQLVAVEPSRYPRHFRALTGFHRDLSRLPRVPAAPPLSWDAARHHLATHAAARNVALG